MHCGLLTPEEQKKKRQDGEWLCLIYESVKAWNRRRIRNRGRQSASIEPPATQAGQVNLLVHSGLMVLTWYVPAEVNEPGDGGYGQWTIIDIA